MSGIYLERNLLRSDAFLGLSKWALKGYLRFLEKRVMCKSNKSKSRSAEKAIVNNGQITFCYSEAKAMGIREREFRNAIDELIERGFLDLTHQGAGGRNRDMSTYFLASRWEKWNTPEFEPAKVLRQKNTKSGEGWAAWNEAQRQQKSLTYMSVERVHRPDKSVRPKLEKNTFRLADMSGEEVRGIGLSA